LTSPPPRNTTTGKDWKSKVMVRGFPPGTTQETMISEVIEPWLSSIDYISFRPGKKPQP
jgi:hypothetical protein